MQPVLELASAHGQIPMDGGQRVADQNVADQSDNSADEP